MKISAEVRKAFREIGRAGGKIGGKRTAANMTKAERVARASKAGKASADAKRARMLQKPV